MASESYCDVIINSTGPTGKEHLSVELRYSFNPEMNEEIKTKVQSGQWMFDAQANPKVWRVTPRYLPFVEEVAAKHFHSARRIEFAPDGNRIYTDLKSGQTFEQKGLF